MKAIYYIQIEDKNIDEGHDTSTLAGLKVSFPELRTLVFSNHAKEITPKYQAAGVETVIYNNSVFKLTNFDEVISAIRAIFTKKNDYVIMFDDSALGNYLAARLASALKVTLLEHVNQVSTEPLSVKHDLTGAKISCQTKITENAVVTISLNGNLTDTGHAKVNIVDWKKDFSTSYSYVPNKDAANDLAYAKVVVAGGQGLGSAAEFEPLGALAKKLNASVGATKAVTDKGWISSNKMIGISNLTVEPSVYYAFGISGAVQHTAGMNKSKNIIAINNDRSAPIFKIANYGIVGDAAKVLARLTALL